MDVSCEFRPGFCVRDVAAALSGDGKLAAAQMVFLEKHHPGSGFSCLNGRHHTGRSSSYYYDIINVNFFHNLPSYL